MMIKKVINSFSGKYLKKISLIGDVCKRSVHCKQFEIPKGVMETTNIYKIEEDFDGGIRIASRTLAIGAVIALPTDTVYGLACDANNPKAIRRLYQIKGRSQNKPVAICVANLQAVRKYGDCRHLAEGLLKELLPGPITIILNRTEHLINPYLNEGLSRIGIRIPNSRFIQELCNRYESQEPLALTSANQSSIQSSLCIEEFQDLWPFIDMVFDSGTIKDHNGEEQRNGSTVIDLSQAGFYKFIRKGIATETTINILQKYGLKMQITNNNNTK